MRRAAAATLSSSLACCLAAVFMACSSSSARSVVDDPAETGAAETGAVATPEAGAPDAPLPYPLDQVCKQVEDDDACRKCGKERCCNTRDALFATDGGADLVACLAPQSCGEACSADCLARYPQQVRVVFDHLGCFNHSCMACDPELPPAPCSVCLAEKCALDDLACDLSPDCYLLSACTKPCDGNKACVTACADKYPAAVPTRNNLVVCSNNRCANECGAEP